MKDYIVTCTGCHRVKRYEYDQEQEAINVADKHQKTRENPVIVLKKVEVRTQETEYEEIYRAKGTSQPARWVFRSV